MRVDRIRRLLFAELVLFVPIPRRRVAKARRLDG
jgi:hypothetical protein